jgi:hypothetical protein
LVLRLGAALAVALALALLLRRRLDLLADAIVTLRVMDSDWGVKGMGVAQRRAPHYSFYNRRTIRREAPSTCNSTK